MGILPLFWKKFFFAIFFRQKDQTHIENVFHQKKMITFLIKIVTSMPFSRYMSIFFWFSMNRSESSVEITSLMPFFLLNPPNTFRKGFQRKKNDHVSDENCDF